MKIQLRLYVIAAIICLFSFFMGAMIHPAWLWLAALVGFSIFQSAFTGFCPMEKLLKALARKKA